MGVRPRVLQNLQDHLNVWQCFPTVDSSPLLASTWETLGWAAVYLWSRRGRLGSCGLEGTAFLYTGRRPREDGPDLQIHFAPAAVNTLVMEINGLAVRAAHPRGWGGGAWAHTPLNVGLAASTLLMCPHAHTRHGVARFVVPS